MDVRNIEDIYPLSSVQEAILLSGVERPDRDRLEQFSLSLAGELQMPLLQAAWETTVSQHEMLRTSFVWENVDRPVQVVHKESNASIDFQDWREFSASEQTDLLRNVVQIERERGADPATIPLRLMVCRTAEQEYQLALSYHRLILDSFSAAFVLKDLFLTYERMFAGQEPLNKRPSSFWHYVEWLQAQDFNEAEKFWKDALADFSTPILLLDDLADIRIVEEVIEPGVQQLTLSPDEAALVNSFAEEQQVNVETMVYGAWAILVSRYSGTDDVLFGLKVSGRPAQLAGADLIAGPFAATLPLRLRISAATPINEWLKTVEALVAQARQYSYLPLSKLQEWSSVGLEKELFGSRFVGNDHEVIEGGLRSLRLGNSKALDANSCPINISLATSNCIELTISYDQLFPAPTIQRMLDQLRVILCSMAADADCGVADVSLITQEQKQQLIQLASGERCSYPKLFIHQLFTERALGQPEAIALAHKDQTLTYRELDRRSNQLANYLRLLGLREEMLVGVLMDRSIDTLIALLGVLKAGAAYVPLDASSPLNRLAFVIDNIQASIVLTQTSLLDLLPATRSHVVCLDSEWEAISEQSSEAPESDLSAQNLAYVIYTSGSTGRPKGVMITHGNLLNYISWAGERYLSAGERPDFALYTSLAFDLTVTSLFLPLVNGLRLVLYEGEDGVETLRGIVGSAGEWILKATPSHLGMLGGGDYERSHVRKLIVGGEALRTKLAATMQESLGAATEIINEYGPTEATVGCMHYAYVGAEGRAEVSIGRGISNVQVYVLDERQELVGEQVRGELYIGGAGVGRGYLGRAELTAERFIPDEYSGAAGARLYRTGDMARYLADGNIEYLGRVDEQVKFLGHRVELGEIRHLLNTHPHVRDSVVVLRPDGRGNQLLVAYYVARQELAVNELRELLGQSLLRETIPNLFVHLKKLPLTINGKINYEGLPAVATVREQERPRVVEERKSPTEEILSGIWAEVLGVEQVGVDDNFFELGGHSLLATQVISRVREAFGIELRLRSLFEQANVRGLAALVETALHGGEAQRSERIGRVSREEPLPLSYAQQRLWFLDQLEPGNPFYNIPLAVRLRGELKLEALERSLNEIIRRHEVLRTSFVNEGGRAVQVVAAELRLRWGLTELSGLSAAEQQVALEQVSRAEAEAPFDLSRGPLLRARLLRLGEKEHVALLTLHHIISDGWSMGVLVREVASLYESYSRGVTAQLPELEIQYGDYAVWQREWLASGVLEEQLEYWNEQLRGAPAVLELPTDRVRPAVQSYRGAMHTATLPAELSKSIKKLGRRENVTLFMTLLAAFQILLRRYSGQDRINVGSPIANRTHGETEQLIGFFLNTLVLSTDLSGDPTFRELLARVREISLGAYAHQEVPFEMLLEDLQPTRELNRTPLFQVMFVLQNAPEERLELSELNVTPVSLFAENASKFDLSLYATERGDLIDLAFVYNVDLFEAATIQRMSAHFRAVLESAVAEPNQRLSTIRLASPAECRQLLAQDSVQPPAKFDRADTEQSLTARIEKMVRLYPENIAVKTRNEQCTYRELSARASCIARTIVRLLPGNEERVALLFEHGVAAIAGLVGALNAGKTYVPLDPSFPQARLTYILQDSQAGMILTDDQNFSRAAELGAGLLPVINIDALTNDHDEREAPHTNISSSAPAYLLYTSGSTGQPKGIVQSHRNVLRHIRNYTNRLQLSAADRLTLLASYGFDAAVMDIFGALLNGATLYPIDLKLENLDRVAQWLSDERISIYHSTPTVYRYVVDALGDARLDLVRSVVLGGEEVFRSDFEAYKEHFGPHCLFVNGFGPTESTVTLQFFANYETQFAGNAVPIGHPVEDTEVFLIDEEGNEADVYQPAEIVIKSDHLALGYWQRPDLTERAFRTEQSNGSAAMRSYFTGDLGRLLPQGGIEYVGRKDYQTKIRGHRVEPGEVESKLREHEAVKETVVLPRTTDAGEKRLVAYVVLKHETSRRELQLFLKQRLPDFMIPQDIGFVDAFPLTANGKVDRSALPDVDRVVIDDDMAGTHQLSEIEGVLAAIWAEVLKLDRVDVDDNFFEIGGHSLIATQIVSRIRQAFHVELPVRRLFETPTISQLAKTVEAEVLDRASIALPPLRPGTRGEQLPLSFAQQRLWFLDQLEPGCDAYNNPLAVRLTGDLNLLLLQRTLNEIVRRHEILRTTFSAIDGEPVQLIHEPAALSLPVIDLTALDQIQRETVTRDLATREERRPFNLATGPLLRVTVIKLGEIDHLVMLTMHHIISDVWSTGVLVEEVAALYKTSLTGEVVSLPELPVQYADYSVWQRQWLQGPVVDNLLAYWQRELAGAPALLRLPTDRPRPAVQTFRGATESLLLSAELSAAIRAISRQEGVTLFMTLLAAFQALLYRYSGQEDIVVGTSIADRRLVETEKLIGFFVNTVALRARFSDRPNFHSLLEAVRETTLSAYAHQDLPFEAVVEALQPLRDPAHSPIFQVFFVLQNARAEALELPELTLSVMGRENTTAKFDLTLFIVEHGNRLNAVLEYNTDLFERETITVMLKHYEQLLQAATAESLTPVVDIPLETLTRPEIIESTDQLAQFAF